MKNNQWVILRNNNDAKLKKIGANLNPSFVLLTIVREKTRGGFRGGGGEGGGRFPRPPLRDSTPCRPKGYFFFDTFSDIHFWPTDPKIFLKAPLAPIYTNFEGGGGERAKKNAIFCQIFSKSAQKRLF